MKGEKYMEDDCCVKLSGALKKHGAIVYTSAIGESDKELPGDYLSLVGWEEGDNLGDYEIGIAIPIKCFQDPKLVELLKKQADRALLRALVGA